MRAAKFLPFVLALVIPVMGSIVNADVGAQSLSWIRYFAGSAVVLGLWYSNEFLLYRNNHLKERLGPGLYLFLGNLAFVACFILLKAFDPNEANPYNSGFFAFRFGFLALLIHLIQRSNKTQTEHSELQLQNMALEKENLSFQLTTMRQQLNPHFLFNSLNTLLDLIEDDRKKAVKYVKSFAKLYRVVLQSSKHDFVPLSEELEFLDDYWSLLKVRFQDAIHLSIDLPPTIMKDMIPPLSLQILVENAVKHNRASKDDPLDIQILHEEGSLIVSNSIKPKMNHEEGEGVGLSNLSERFSLLGNPMTYGSDDDQFVVRLPLYKA